MIRRFSILIAILIVLLVVGNLAGIKVLQIGKLVSMKGSSQPPEVVSTAIVREETWQGSLTAIGSIAAAQGVTVTAELPGTIREIAFESGTVVAKDALLVCLDTTSEKAQLRAVEAQVQLAQINLDRALNLRTNNMTSQAEVDTAEATLKQFQANADTIRTTIAKKTIRAPFGGQLGIRRVNLGQYLEAGKPVVSLQSLSPVYVDFSLPQQHVSKLKTGMKVRVTTDAYPGQPPFEGTLTAINPDLDAGTRSIGLQATFENQDFKLRPGMFAQVEVLLPEQQKVLVIPGTSILSAAYSDSVFVVENRPETTNSPAGMYVRQQLIRAGRMRGDIVSVETGLKEGQKVVSLGAFKLRNDMRIEENNKLVPPISEAPRPENN